MQSNDLKTAGQALIENEEISVLTLGCSMRPMLRQHKDIVVIKRIDCKLKKGDVVLYPGNNDQYILHRIMRVRKDGYVIRGDNNYFTEYGITDSNIVGVLKEFYRNGKYVNCASSKGYKLYIFYIRHSYYLRYLWKKIIRPTLGKIKRFIIDLFCSGQ